MKNIGCGRDIRNREQSKAKIVVPKEGRETVRTRGEEVAGNSRGVFSEEEVAGVSQTERILAEKK